LRQCEADQAICARRDKGEEIEDEEEARAEELRRLGYLETFDKESDYGGKDKDDEAEKGDDAWNGEDHVDADVHHDQGVGVDMEGQEAEWDQQAVEGDGEDEDFEDIDPAAYVEEEE
jgi:hypothetical protein